MNEILRDRARATIRLVMNPDRMVIVEAQRTFTYLNLYGYLTDAVIVNRVFPDDVEGGYFGAWRERQQEHLRLVERGLRAGPGADRPLLRGGGDRRARCSIGWPESCSPSTAPEDVLHTELAHDVVSENGRTVLRLRMPFAERGDVSLKKVGPELVVTVGHEKRTIILPSALARRRPSGARLEGGSLEVSFEDDRSPRAEPDPTARRPPSPEPLTSAHALLRVRGVVPDLPDGGRPARDRASRAARPVAGRAARGAADHAGTDRQLPGTPRHRAGPTRAVQDIPID